MDQSRTIVWPIEPRQSDSKNDTNILNFLTLLAKKTDFEIQPVSVVSADYFTTSEYFEPIDTKVLREHIAADCEDYLKQFSAFNIKKTLILENHHRSQSAEVRLFAQFVENDEPDLVLITSHGRTGWTRYFMGSFTESFLLQSQVPVIVLGPEYQKQKELSRALMPIEIDDSSLKFVENFLDQHSMSFLDSIVLFHKISMLDLEDIAWAPSLYGFSGWESANLIEQARKTTRSFLSGFMEHPLSKKRLSYEVSESVDPVADIIVERVKDPSVNLLIMRSEAGPITARVLGSVTREVVRQASVPVVVYPFRYKPE